MFIVDVSKCQEHTVAVHLEALDLAHRWQLNHVVEALETKLVKETSEITRLDLKDVAEQMRSDSI